MSIRISPAGMCMASIMLAVSACGGDEGAPAVHASQFAPADGAKGVDLHGSLQITFDGALDPASVTPDHVLLLRYGYTRPATVSYDDTTQVVTVVPSGGLGYDTPYVLLVTGVHDASGRTVADASATFSTWVNAKVSETNVSGYAVEYTLDDAGYTIRATHRDGSGAIAYYVTYERTDAATDERLVTAKEWIAPGPDGQWFTADDVLGFQEDDTYEDNGALSTRHGSQNKLEEPPSAEWRLSYAYDAQGTAVDVEWVYGGEDLVLGTSDDFHESTITTGDAAARQTSVSWICEELQPDPACSDSTAVERDAFSPGTAGSPDVTTISQSQPWDSCTSAKSEDTLDGRGNVIRHVEYEAYAWFGECGVQISINDYVEYQVDEHDRIGKAITYTGPGPDGQWFTPDDVVTDIAVYDTMH